MSHDHKHQHCKHERLKYCAHCDKPYCLDCSQEWNRYRNFNDWYWQRIPATYPQYTLTAQSGTSSGNMSAIQQGMMQGSMPQDIGISLANCTHNNAK